MAPVITFVVSIFLSACSSQKVSIENPASDTFQAGAGLYITNISISSMPAPLPMPVMANQEPIKLKLSRVELAR